MTPTSIAPNQNPGGLISVVYENDAVIRRSNLSTGDLLGVDAAAIADAEATTDGRVTVLYDGDSGAMVARLRFSEEA